MVSVFGILQVIDMKTSEFGKGYIVCTDERLVCRYNTLEEAENHIKYQREHFKSTINWYIVHIKDVDWVKTDRYERKLY